MRELNARTDKLLCFGEVAGVDVDRVHDRLRVPRRDIFVEQQRALAVVGPMTGSPRTAGFHDNERMRDLIEIFERLAKGFFPEPKLRGGLLVEEIPKIS